VIQGFTLLPLMRLLRFEDDGAVERELSRPPLAPDFGGKRHPLWDSSQRDLPV
jgi:hypothetical protein